MTGPGCSDFERQSGDVKYIHFNRTPYYKGMADLEGRLREKTSLADKFKFTVAQMIVMEISK